MASINVLNRINLEWFSAFFTWALVSLSALLFMFNSSHFSNLQIGTAAGLFLLFYLLWSLTTRDRPFKRDRIVRGGLIAAAYIAIVLLYFMVPYTYTAILGVILCCSLPLIMPFRYAMACSLLFSVPLWLIYTLYWQRENMLITTVLFWTFNLFALVMINAMVQAREAHAHSQQINRELLATQTLLTEATKQSERIRIARNIHDLLGHHLTALTIKLQVAQRLTRGQAKDEIDDCHQLAKLLLSDVREAVSEIRSRSQIDLLSAIESLRLSTPQMQIEIDSSASVNISDVQQANAVLRAIQESITNSLKHAKADRFSIIISQTEQTLTVTLQDNGQSDNAEVIPGNGLTGIQERIHALNGTVNFRATTEGFITDLSIPLNQELV